jgi:subtilisin-like proprotein convertase family protein
MKPQIVVRVALALLFLLADISAKADSFAGTGLGDIPDDGPVYPTDGQYGTPKVVSFNVSNLQTSVQSVALTLSIYHPALGELDVQLTSPAGTNFTIFSRVGPSNAGFGNQGILGTSFGTDYTNYTFVDSATNTLLSYNPSGANISMPSGSYRTSSAGPSNEVATTFAINSGFVGLTPAQANGTWTLTFRDAIGGNQGAVQSAALVLGQGSSQPPPPRFTRIGVTNGVVTLTLTGPNNQSYRLYTTTNLASPQNWSTNGGGTFDGSGKAAFTTNTVGPACFYRVSTP